MMSEHFHDEEPIGPNERGELERYEDVRAFAGEHEKTLSSLHVWEPRALMEMPRKAYRVSNPLLAAVADACTVDGVIRECRFMQMRLDVEAAVELGKAEEN